jgi:hypothetical protein
MSDERILKNYGNTVTGFKTEDGKHYRTTHGDYTDVIEHVRHMDQKVNEAPKATNRNGYKHIGTIPVPILEDWLIRHNYSMHEFAINAGGEKGKTNPYGGGGVKDKFLKFFLSKDFSKLHNM